MSTPINFNVATEDGGNLGFKLDVDGNLYQITNEADQSEASVLITSLSQFIGLLQS